MIFKVEYGNVDVSSEAVVSEKNVKKIGAKELEKVIGDETVKIEGEYIEVQRKSEPGYYFGFGDKVGPIDRKGRKYYFWNTDNFTHHPSADPLYKSFPFYIYVSKDLSKIYGIFVDYPGWMIIDLDSDNDGYIKIKARGSGFSQYVITGKNVKEVLNQYLKLTGKNIAFPLWAFGYQQSRWSYFDENEVLTIAKTFREKKIPCDAIYLDIDFMDNYKVFTWNPKNFKNYKEMLKKLHKDGFKVIPILDPGVKIEEGYFAFEDGKKKKVFLKGKDGKDLEGAVWPGRVRFPDFRSKKVRKWWAQNVKKYLDEGIDGFWNDMNEIAIFATEADIKEAIDLLQNSKLEDGINLAGKLGMIGEIGRRGHGDDIVHLDGTPHWKVKNTYGFNMIRATSEMLQKENKRPFLITRSAYSGVQRFGGVWTGDNHSWWEHILQEITRLNSLSLVGVFYSGCDVGGFGGDANAELLIRFMQFGAFTPMFRNHSAIGTRRQEPWQFGQEVEKILKNVIETRYKLLPYIYTNYMMGVLKNIPLVRPMFYDYPSQESFRLEDQYLFGNALIVAPIYRPNVQKRLVWLPKKAKGFFDGKDYRKGWNIVDVTIENIPVFQLQDSAIPLTKVVQYTTKEIFNEIEWKVVFKNKAVGYLYEDNGETLDYKKGKYNLWKLIVTKEKIIVEKLHSGYDGPERVWKVNINGKVIEVKVGNNAKSVFTW